MLIYSPNAFKPSGVVSSVSAYKDAFEVKKKKNLSSFPSIALRIPTAHNFTRD